jgi:hypothetical protein
MHVHCQFYCDWQERARELMGLAVSLSGLVRSVGILDTRIRMGVGVGVVGICKRFPLLYQGRGKHHAGLKNLVKM